MGARLLPQAAPSLLQMFSFTLLLSALLLLEWHHEIHLLLNPLSLWDGAAVALSPRPLGGVI